MPRMLTAMLLGFVTAWCALAAVFGYGLFIKSAFSDFFSLGVAAASVVSVVCMWLAFRARRLGVAWLFAAAPMILSVGVISMIRTPAL